VECTVKPLDDCSRQELAAVEALTKEGSDFQKSLRDGVYRGHIALVFNHGRLVGWVRSEPWHEEQAGYWDTLEAFVHHDFRGLGIATFAATGLKAAGVAELGSVAVFHPRMLMVAKSAGLFPTLFEKDIRDQWKRA
jgi:hypothetical protein